MAVFGGSDLVLSASVTGIPESIEKGARKGERALQKALSIGATKGTAGLDQAFDRWKQPLGRITGDMGEFQKSLDASTARVLAFGASVGVLAAIQNGFIGTLKAAHDVEKALMDINVVMNLSSSALEDFSSRLFEVARNTAQSFDTVAVAATELARQGLSAEETLTRLNDSLILTRLSGLDAEEAVATLTAAVNSYGQVALNTTEIVNRLANVDAAFAVSSNDLAQALQRASATAMGAKVSFNELLAVVTSVQQSTARGGSVIGNAFKSIFTRIQRSKVRETLEDIGVATMQANGSFRDGMSVLKDYAKVYYTLTDAQKAYTAEQIAGVFQINNLKALVADLNGEFSIYDKALKVANSSTNQATERNKALNKTFAALVKDGVLAVQELAAAVGELQVEGGFSNLLAGFTTVIDQIRGLFDPKEGNSLAKGLVGGLAEFLTGPGMILIALGIGKMMAFMAKQTAGAAKAILSIGSRAEKQKQVEAAIGKILANNRELYHDIAEASGDVEKQEKLITNHLREENRQYKETLELVTNIAKQRGIIKKYDVRDGNLVPRGSRRSSSPGTPLFNEGYVPSFAGGTLGALHEENRAIQQGVGGARKSAKAVPIKNFPVGKGKKSNVVVNTDEYIVPNFGGGDGSAVFNRKMVKKFGLPKGSRKVSAAGGFIPNFQAETAEYDRGFKDYLKDAQNLANQFFISRARPVSKVEIGEHPTTGQMLQGRPDTIFVEALSQDFSKSPTEGTYKLTMRGAKGKIKDKDLASFIYSIQTTDLAEQGFPGRSEISMRLNSFQSTQAERTIKGVKGEYPWMERGQALEYLKELAGYNSQKGNFISVSDGNTQIWQKQFLGIGREQIAFKETGDVKSGSVVGKALLERSYQNIDPVTNLIKATKSGVIKQSSAPQVEKFEAREKFLQLLQEESVNILGSNVRFPKRFEPKRDPQGNLIHITEEDVLDEGGEDFLQFYSKTQQEDKEAARGLLQAYLTKLNLDAKEALDLVTLQKSGAINADPHKSQLAFPNLDPAKHTVAASDSPGRVGKVTDNMIFATAQDAVAARDLINRSDYKEKFIAYSRQYETLANNIKAYRETKDEHQKTLLAQQIVNETNAIKKSTAVLFSAMPEMGDIQRILLDYETGVTRASLEKPIVRQNPKLRQGLKDLMGEKDYVAVAGGLMPSVPKAASRERAEASGIATDHKGHIEILSNMIIGAYLQGDIKGGRGGTRRAREELADAELAELGASQHTAGSISFGSSKIIDMLSKARIGGESPYNIGEILKEMGVTQISTVFPLEDIVIPEGGATVQGVKGEWEEGHMEASEMAKILSASGQNNELIGNVAEAAWLKSTGQSRGYLSTAKARTAVVDAIHGSTQGGTLEAGGAPPVEVKGGELKANNLVKKNLMRFSEKENPNGLFVQLHDIAKKSADTEQGERLKIALQNFQAKRFAQAMSDLVQTGHVTGKDLKVEQKDLTNLRDKGHLIPAFSAAYTGEKSKVPSQNLLLEKNLDKDYWVNLINGLGLAEGFIPNFQQTERYGEMVNVDRAIGLLLSQISTTPQIALREMIQNALAHGQGGEHKGVLAQVETGDTVTSTLGLNTPLTKIAVSDFGQGMTPSEVFKHFLRLLDTGKKEDSGELGLAGFGLGKASIIKGGDKFKLDTVGKVGERQIRTQVDTTPTGWINFLQNKGPTVNPEMFQRLEGQIDSKNFKMSWQPLPQQPPELKEYLELEKAWFAPEPEDATLANTGGIKKFEEERLAYARRQRELEAAYKARIEAAGGTLEVEGTLRKWADEAGNLANLRGTTVGIETRDADDWLSYQIGTMGRERVGPLGAIPIGEMYSGGGDPFKKQIEKRMERNPMRELAGFSLKKLDKSTLQKQIHSEGGSLEIWYDETSPPERKEFGFALPILSEGVPYHSWPMKDIDFVPKNLVANITSKLPPTHELYPWDIDRGNLRGEFGTQVKKHIAALSGHLKGIQQKAALNRPTFPIGKTGLDLIDVSASVPEEKMVAMARQPQVGDLANVINSIFNSIVETSAAYDPAMAGATLKGMGVGGRWMGLNIAQGSRKKNSLFGSEAGTTDMELAPTQSVIDPLIHIEAVSQKLRKANLEKLDMTQEEAMRDLMAREIYSTLTHEAAHQINRTEGEGHARAMEFVMSRTMQHAGSHFGMLKGVLTPELMNYLRLTSEEFKEFYNKDKSKEFKQAIESMGTGFIPNFANLDNIVNISQKLKAAQKGGNAKVVKQETAALKKAVSAYYTQPQLSKGFIPNLAEMNPGSRGESWANKSGLRMVQRTRALAPNITQTTGYLDKLAKEAFDVLSTKIIPFKGGKLDRKGDPLLGPILKKDKERVSLARMREPDPSTGMIPESAPYESIELALKEEVVHKGIGHKELNLNKYGALPIRSDWLEVLESKGLTNDDINHLMASYAQVVKDLRKDPTDTYKSLSDPKKTMISGGAAQEAAFRRIAANKEGQKIIAAFRQAEKNIAAEYPMPPKPLSEGFIPNFSTYQELFRGQRHDKKGTGQARLVDHPRIPFHVLAEPLISAKTPEEFKKTLKGFLGEHTSGQLSQTWTDPTLKKGEPRWTKEGGEPSHKFSLKELVKQRKSSGAVSWSGSSVVAEKFAKGISSPGSRHTGSAVGQIDLDDPGYDEEEINKKLEMAEGMVWSKKINPTKMWDPSTLNQFFKTGKSGLIGLTGEVGPDQSPLAWLQDQIRHQKLKDIYATPARWGQGIPKESEITQLFNQGFIPNFIESEVESKEFSELSLSLSEFNRKNMVVPPLQALGPQKLFKIPTRNKDARQATIQNIRQYVSSNQFRDLEEDLQSKIKRYYNLLFTREEPFNPARTFTKHHDPNYEGKIVAGSGFIPNFLDYNLETQMGTERSNRPTVGEQLAKTERIALSQQAFSERIRKNPKFKFLEKIWSSIPTPVKTGLAAGTAVPLPGAGPIGGLIGLLYHLGWDKLIKKTKEEQVPTAARGSIPLSAQDVAKAKVAHAAEMRRIQQGLEQAKLAEGDMEWNEGLKEWNSIPAVHDREFKEELRKRAKLQRSKQRVTTANVASGFVPNFAQLYQGVQNRSKTPWGPQGPQSNFSEFQDSVKDFADPWVKGGTLPVESWDQYMRDNPQDFDILQYNIDDTLLNKVMKGGLGPQDVPAQILDPLSPQPIGKIRPDGTHVIPRMNLKESKLDILSVGKWDKLGNTLRHHLGLHPQGGAKKIPLEKIADLSSFASEMGYHEDEPGKKAIFNKVMGAAAMGGGLIPNFIDLFKGGIKNKTTGSDLFFEGLSTELFYGDPRDALKEAHEGDAFKRVHRKWGSNLEFMLAKIYLKNELLRKGVGGLRGKKQSPFSDQMVADRLGPEFDSLTEGVSKAEAEEYREELQESKNMLNLQGAYEKGFITQVAKGIYHIPSGGPTEDSIWEELEIGRGQRNFKFLPEDTVNQYMENANFWDMMMDASEVSKHPRQKSKTFFEEGYESLNPDRGVSKGLGGGWIPNFIDLFKGGIKNKTTGSDLFFEGLSTELFYGDPRDALKEAHEGDAFKRVHRKWGSNLEFMLAKIYLKNELLRKGVGGLRGKKQSPFSDQMVADRLGPEFDSLTEGVSKAEAEEYREELQESKNMLNLQGAYEKGFITQVAKGIYHIPSGGPTEDSVWEELGIRLGGSNFKFLPEETVNQYMENAHFWDMMMDASEVSKHPRQKSKTFFEEGYESLNPDKGVSKGFIPNFALRFPLEGKQGGATISEAGPKTQEELKKLLQDPANKDKLIKFLYSNPIEVSHNRALKEATGEAFYEITDGNHRYELAQLAGIHNIPVSAKSQEAIGVEGDAFNFKKAMVEEDAGIHRGNKPEWGQLLSLLKHIGIGAGGRKLAKGGQQSFAAQSSAKGFIPNFANAVIDSSGKKQVPTASLWGRLLALNPDDGKPYYRSTGTSHGYSTASGTKEAGLWYPTEGASFQGLVEQESDDGMVSVYQTEEGITPWIKKPHDETQPTRELQFLQATTPNYAMSKFDFAPPDTILKTSQAANEWFMAQKRKNILLKAGLEDDDTRKKLFKTLGKEKFQQYGSQLFEAGLKNFGPKREMEYIQRMSKISPAIKGALSKASVIAQGFIPNFLQRGYVTPDGKIYDGKWHTDASAQRLRDAEAEGVENPYTVQMKDVKYRQKEKIIYIDRPSAGLTKAQKMALEKQGVINDQFPSTLGPFDATEQALIEEGKRQVAEATGSFYGQRKSKGKEKSFVPNFANALHDAISREKSALRKQGSKASVYVDRDKRVKSPQNPMGLLVANSRDEPKGGFQGVERYTSRGLNPKLAGKVAARGMIPNFAQTLDVDSEIDKIDSVTEAIRSGKRGVLVTAKWDAIGALLDEEQALLEEQLEGFEAGVKAQKEFPDRLNEINATLLSLDTTIKDFDKEYNDKMDEWAGKMEAALPDIDPKDREKLDKISAQTDPSLKGLHRQALRTETTIKSTDSRLPAVERQKAKKLLEYIAAEDELIRVEEGHTQAVLKRKALLEEQDQIAEELIKAQRGTLRSEEEYNAARAKLNDVMEQQKSLKTGRELIERGPKKGGAREAKTKLGGTLKGAGAKVMDHIGGFGVQSSFYISMIGNVVEEMMGQNARLEGMGDFNISKAVDAGTKAASMSSLVGETLGQLPGPLGAIGKVAAVAIPLIAFVASGIAGAAMSFDELSKKIDDANAKLTETSNKVDNYVTEQEKLNKAIEAGDSDAVTKSLNNITNSLSQLGDPDIALQLADAGTSLKELGKISDSIKEGIDAKKLNNDITKKIAEGMNVKENTGVLGMLGLEDLPGVGDRGGQSKGGRKLIQEGGEMRALALDLDTVIAAGKTATEGLGGNMTEAANAMRMLGVPAQEISSMLAQGSKGFYAYANALKSVTEQRRVTALIAEQMKIIHMATANLNKGLKEVSSSMLHAATNINEAHSAIAPATDEIFKGILDRQEALGLVGKTERIDAASSFKQKQLEVKSALSIEKAAAEFMEATRAREAEEGGAQQLEDTGFGTSVIALREEMARGGDSTTNALRAIRDLNSKKFDTLTDEEKKLRDELIKSANELESQTALIKIQNQLQKQQILNAAITAQRTSKFDLSQGKQFADLRRVFEGIGPGAQPENVFDAKMMADTMAPVVKNLQTFFGDTPEFTQMAKETGDMSQIANVANMFSQLTGDLGVLDVSNLPDLQAYLNNFVSGNELQRIPEQLRGPVSAMAAQFDQMSKAAADAGVSLEMHLADKQKTREAQTIMQTADAFGLAGFETGEGRTQEDLLKLTKQFGERTPELLALQHIDKGINQLVAIQLKLFSDSTEDQILDVTKVSAENLKKIENAESARKDLAQQLKNAVSEAFPNDSIDVNTAFIKYAQGKGGGPTAGGFVPSFAPTGDSIKRALRTERAMGASRPVVDHHASVGTYVRDAATQSNFAAVRRDHPEGIKTAVKNSQILQGASKGFVPSFAKYDPLAYLTPRERQEIFNIERNQWDGGDKGFEVWKKNNPEIYKSMINLKILTETDTSFGTKGIYQDPKELWQSSGMARSVDLGGVGSKQWNDVALEVETTVQKAIDEHVKSLNGDEFSASMRMRGGDTKKDPWDLSEDFGKGGFSNFEALNDFLAQHAVGGLFRAHYQKLKSGGGGIEGQSAAKVIEKLKQEWGDPGRGTPTFLKGFSGDDPGTAAQLEAHRDVFKAFYADYPMYFNATRFANYDDRMGNNVDVVSPMWKAVMEDVRDKKKAFTSYSESLKDNLLNVESVVKSSFAGGMLFKDNGRGAKFGARAVKGAYTKAMEYDWAGTIGKAQAVLFSEGGKEREALKAADAEGTYWGLVLGAWNDKKEAYLNTLEFILRPDNISDIERAVTKGGSGQPYKGGWESTEPAQATAYLQHPFVKGSAIEGAAITPSSTLAQALVAPNPVRSKAGMRLGVDLADGATTHGVQLFKNFGIGQIPYTEFKGQEGSKILDEARSLYALAMWRQNPFWSGDTTSPPSLAELIFTADPNAGNFVLKDKILRSEIGPKLQALKNKDYSLRLPSAATSLSAEGAETILREERGEGMDQKPEAQLGYYPAWYSKQSLFNLRKEIESKNAILATKLNAAVTERNEAKTAGDPDREKLLNYKVNSFQNALVTTGQQWDILQSNQAKFDKFNEKPLEQFLAEPWIPHPTEIGDGAWIKPQGWKSGNLLPPGLGPMDIKAAAHEKGSSAELTLPGEPQQREEQFLKQLAKWQSDNNKTLLAENTEIMSNVAGMDATNLLAALVNNISIGGAMPAEGEDFAARIDSYIAEIEQTVKTSIEDKEKGLWQVGPVKLGTRQLTEKQKQEAQTRAQGAFKDVKEEMVGEKVKIDPGLQPPDAEKFPDPAIKAAEGTLKLRDAMYAALLETPVGAGGAADFLTNLTSYEEALKANTREEVGVIDRNIERWTRDYNVAKNRIAKYEKKGGRKAPPNYYEKMETADRLIVSSEELLKRKQKILSDPRSTERKEALSGLISARGGRDPDWRGFIGKYAKQEVIKDVGKFSKSVIGRVRYGNVDAFDEFLAGKKVKYPESLRGGEGEDKLAGPDYLNLIGFDQFAPAGQESLLYHVMAAMSDLGGINPKGEQFLNVFKGYDITQMDEKLGQFFEKSVELDPNTFDKLAAILIRGGIDKEALDLHFGEVLKGGGTPDEKAKFSEMVKNTGLVQYSVRNPELQTASPQLPEERYTFKALREQQAKYIGEQATELRWIPAIPFIRKQLEFADAPMRGESDEEFAERVGMAQRRRALATTGKAQNVSKGFVPNFGTTEELRNLVGKLPLNKQEQLLGDIKTDLTVPVERLDREPSINIDATPGGSGVIRGAAGFVPNFNQIIGEIAASQDAGYKRPVTASQVKSINIPGRGKTTYNTQEKVVNVPGMRQPFIVPPKDSRASKSYGHQVQKKFGFSPYTKRAADGLVPNFAETATIDTESFQKSARTFEEAVTQFRDLLATATIDTRELDASIRDFQSVLDGGFNATVQLQGITELQDTVKQLGGVLAGGINGSIDFSDTLSVVVDGNIGELKAAMTTALQNVAQQYFDNQTASVAQSVQAEVNRIFGGST